LVPLIVKKVLLSHLNFKDEFWEVNKDYVVQDIKANDIHIDYNYNDYFYKDCEFPVKDKTHKTTKYMFTVFDDCFARYEKEIYTFIEEFIFQNPINRLS
jgi:hypothetical protein